MDIGKSLNFVDQLDYTKIKSYIEKSNLNKRVKIDTGKFCNKSCSFCYYKNQLNNTDFLSPDNAFVITKYLLSQGIEEVELSGGEPTKNPYIQDIIKSIKRGFLYHNKKPKISMVTNGSLRFDSSTREFYESFSDILISVHGYQEVHNMMVGDKRPEESNSFDRIEQLIKEISYNNFTKIRLNIVVNHWNLEENGKYFLEWLQYLIETEQIIQINFLPMNFWSDNKDFIMTREQYQQIYKSLNSFVTELISRQNKYSYKFFQNKGSINIRYGQVCLLHPDIQKYNVSHYDHLYDKTDWNKIFYPKDLTNEFKVKHDIYLNKYNSDLGEILYSTSFNSKLGYLNEKNINELVIKDQKESHLVDSICFQCINKGTCCDGVKKGYYDNELKEDVSKRKIFMKKCQEKISKWII